LIEHVDLQFALSSKPAVTAGEEKRGELKKKKRLSEGTKGYLNLSCFRCIFRWEEAKEENTFKRRRAEGASSPTNCN